MRKSNSQKRISRPDHVLSVRQGGTFITYDKEADAAYFRVRSGKISRTVKLHDWLLVDLDKDGRLLGVESLFVSTKAPRKSISKTIRGGIPVSAAAA